MHLIINETVQQSLKRLKNYAEKHPLSMDDLLDTYNKQLEPVGTTEEHSCYVPTGFKVVFSIEKQVHGNTRHLSMSVDREGKLPSPQAVYLIMQLLGFTCTLEGADQVWVEEYAPNQSAINVLEVI